MKKILLFVFLILLFASVSTSEEILVEAGAVAISAALAVIWPDDVLVLTTDGGIYTESAAVKIFLSVTIKAADGLAIKPTWVTDGSNHITLQNNLSLEEIVFEGAATAASAIVNEVSEGNENVPKVNKCEFQNFTKAAIYKDGDGNHPITSSIVPFDSVIVSNSLFRDCGAGIVLDGDHPSGGGQHSDNIPGSRYLSVENCTFYNMDKGSDNEDSAIKLEAYIPPGEPVFFNINHVTVDKYRLYGFLLKELNTASTVNNNIVTNCKTGIRIKYNPPLFVTTYNNVWNNGTDYKGDTGAGVSAGNGSISADPMYADAANGDFTLIEGSPCIGTANDSQNMGDLRWSATGVDDTEKALPTLFSLHQNYPNPFNPETSISYSIEKTDHVTLDIYSISGEKVRTLVHSTQAPGVHSVIWNSLDDMGHDLAAGIYFARLQTTSGVRTNKMVLIK